MFELKTKDVKSFGETMKLIAGISPEEFYMWSEDKNLKMGCIDSSHVVLAEFSLSGKNVSMRGEIKDKIIVADTKYLANLLKLASKGDVFKMNYREDTLNLNCIVSDEDERNIYVSAGFSVELNDELPSFPRDLDGFFKTSISSLKSFSKALKYQMQFADQIKVSICNSVLKLEGRADRKVESTIALSSQSDIITGRKIESRINSEFLGVIEKTLQTASQLDICIKENAPIIFQFELKDRIGMLKYLISPIIEGI